MFYILLTVHRPGVAGGGWEDSDEDEDAEEPDLILPDSTLSSFTRQSQERETQSTMDRLILHVMNRLVALHTYCNG